MENGLESKLWTPASLRFEDRGKMAVLSPANPAPRLDAGALFEKTDYLSTILKNMTSNMALTFALSGIIGLGKSTVPKIMRLYMDAVEYNEDTNTLPLQLLYHDMETYGFPFQFYVGERRWALNQSARKSPQSKIIDRSPYEDFLFTLNFVDMKAMSLIQSELIKEMMKEKIKENGHPEVLIWLQGTPETAYSRIQKRGIQYEAEGKERPLTKDEVGEIDSIRDYFVGLVGKYAPSELARYKDKQLKAGTPNTMIAGGISLDYLKSLHKRYHNDFEDVLTLMDFDGVLLKLNVDDRDGVDKRTSFDEQVAMMSEIKDASFLGLHRKGYKLRERNGILMLESPFENKKPYIYS